MCLSLPKWFKISWKFVALILITASIFLIRYFLLNPKLKNSDLITIDALITSSTIAFAAFMNYSSNGSGSSMATRKLNWSSFKISSSSSKTFRFLNIFMFPFTNNMVFLISFSVLFSTLIPFFSIFGTLLFSAYLFVSVSLSGLILLGVLYRYVLFNSEPYKYSAEIFIKKAKQIVLSKNKEKEKSFGRTYLNVLRSTKNITILNEFAKRLNKYKDDENFKYLFNKFSEIIQQSNMSLKDSVKIYFSLYFYETFREQGESVTPGYVIVEYEKFISMSQTQLLRKYKVNLLWVVVDVIEEHEMSAKSK